MTLHSEIFEQPQRLASLLENQKPVVVEIANAIRSREIYYAFLAARGLPGAWTALWTVVAAVAVRTAAMTFNRLADRRFDAANPRTAGRHLPAGILSVSSVAAFAAASAMGFIAATLLSAADGECQACRAYLAAGGAEGSSEATEERPALAE